MTVRGKGVLEVLDGGSLEIVTGNLKLLAGTLPATALKNHIWVTMSDTVTVPVTAEKGWKIGQWHKYGTLTLTPPEWAKTGIIFALTLYKGHIPAILATADYLEVRIRAIIGGKLCPEGNPFFVGYDDYRWIHFGALDCQTVPVTVGENIVIDFEHTVSGQHNQFYDRGTAELTGFAIWMG